VNRISRNEAATARHRSKQRPIVRIHLFGAMRATTYLGENILPRGKRARAVLGYLCLAPDHQVSPAELAGMLWDQAPKAAARANLGRALRDLSAAFGGFADELFVAGRDLVRLNADACWIDAAALLALDPSGFDGTKGGSKALCRGVLLEGLDGTSASFDRWLAAERERLAGRLEALLTREREQAEESRARGREQALADTSVHRGMRWVVLRMARHGTRCW